MGQRITIRDVAEEAGVSHMTVSRVLNNKGKISAGTRQKVLAAIEKLNFRPSRTARNLATRRAHAIGLIVPDIANPFFGEIANGVQEAAQGKDYHVFLATTGWDPQEERKLLYSLASYPVDGIILCSARGSDDELRAFCDYFYPVVLGGRRLDQSKAQVVLRDSHAGMQLALQHLLTQGHRAIGMVAGPITAPTISTEMHTAGFRQAAAALQLPLQEKWIGHGPTTPEGGYSTTLALLARAPELTALCAHNDLVAIGALKACRELGRRVPEDCAVIGYNDIQLASMIDPALTTIRVGTAERGRAHVQQIFAMLESAEADPTLPIYPEPELIVRESG